MTRLRPRAGFLIALLAVVVVAGCRGGPGADALGPTRYMQDVALIESLMGSLRSGGRDRAPIEPTRALIASFDEPLLYVRRENGAQGGMLRVGLQNGYGVWRGVDGAGVVLRDGLVSATRGYGADLYTAALGDLPRLIRTRQAGTTRRLHRYLTGVDVIEGQSFQCTVTVEGSEAIAVAEIMRPTRRLRETCVDLTGRAAESTARFENTYWVGSDGTIWRSFQWLGAGIGQTRIDRLIK